MWSAQRNCIREWSTISIKICKRAHEFIQGQESKHHNILIESNRYMEVKNRELENIKKKIVKFHCRDWENKFPEVV